jgi:drug/metabolite transporter (DMT)-like permease
VVQRRALGVALAVTSAASFGVMPVLTKVVYDDGADTFGVLSFRFSLAALVLLGLALVRGERLPRGRRLASLAALFLHQRPSGRATACVATATVGTALTAGPVAGGQGTGVLLGLAAAASYAVYIVVGSRTTAGVGPFATSAVVMGACGLVYDGLALTRGASYPTKGSAWLALLGVCLLGTVVAVACFFGALALLGPSDTAVLSTVEPVVSVVVAMLMLDEVLTPLQAAGGALVLAAVVVLARIGSATPAPDIREGASKG